jgi:hypothetical protein
MGNLKKGGKNKSISRLGKKKNSVSYRYRFRIHNSLTLKLIYHDRQVARCTKIINADSEDPKYIINVKQFAKFVVDLADSVAPTDIEVEILNAP